MAFTPLTVEALPGPWGTAPTVLTFTAGDAVNGNSFLCDGLTFLIAFNSGGLTYTVLIAGAPDADTGRNAGTAVENITAGQYRVYPLFPVQGWRQSDLMIHVTVSNAAVKLAACRIAAGAGFGGTN